MEIKDALEKRRAFRSFAPVDIDVSLVGWDSEMIEYPFVFEHKNKRYMLYNGNHYGKTGFGIAVQKPAI